MKRLNPDTGVPFKYGDMRSDGYRFVSYVLKHIKRDGYHRECWLSPSKFERHNERNNLKARERYAENPEAKLEMNRRHYRKNKGYYRAKVAKREAAKMQRTPSWLTEEDLYRIQLKYNTAQYMTQLTGEQYHVDHIVPLQGAEVSGLHVPSNLRVITAKENLSKNNTFEEGYNAS